MSLRNALIIIVAFVLIIGGYFWLSKSLSTHTQTPTETHEEIETVPIETAPVDQEISGSLSLKHVGGFSLPLGTHRPELLAAVDGTFYIVVVEPKGANKHFAYHYDAEGKQLGEAFPVSLITDAYGEPADHRALLFADQLVVVYQSNVWKDGNQSLILARFTLDGKLVKRTPIVANAPTGSGENFPDFAITWFNNALTITTGTANNQLKIRQVDLDGNILSTQTYPVKAGTALSSEIGNSLFVDAEGHLNLVSGNGPGSTESLVVTTFDDDGEASVSVRLPSTGREETFPTDNTGASGYELIAYISRASGGSAAVESNAYDPYLKILDAQNHVLADVQVGQGGFMHVHPTVAVSGDKIFVAWSRSVNGQPQVQVEEYSLTQK